MLVLSILQCQVYMHFTLYDNISTSMLPFNVTNLDQVKIRLLSMEAYTTPCNLAYSYLGIVAIICSLLANFATSVDL